MEFGSAERDERFDTSFIAPRQEPEELPKLESEALTDQGVPETLHLDFADESGWHGHIDHVDIDAEQPPEPEAGADPDPGESDELSTDQGHQDQLPVDDGDGVDDDEPTSSEHEEVESTPAGDRPRAEVPEHDADLPPTPTDLPSEPLGPETWLNLDDVPHKLVENVIAEVFAEIADSTAFPAGQFLRVIRHLVSQPKLMIPIAEYGDDCKLRVHTAVTPDGLSLELDVHGPDTETPPAAATDRPPGNPDWVDYYFWMASDLPCAVAVTPHTILQDLARLPRLDAEAVAAQIERGTVVAKPYVMVLPVPFTKLALVGWHPAKGRPRFTAVAQPSRGASEVHLWTVIG